MTVSRCRRHFATLVRRSLVASLALAVLVSLWRLHSRLVLAPAQSTPASFPPVDLVIPWAGEAASTDVRQRDNGELRYALRSYAKYAPWLRHIYILQNGDQPPPSFLKPNGWIYKVDRCQCFANASHCPTRNGQAAQAVAPNIPGLSEYFIIADDDTFLTSPTSPLDWFTPDGRPIVRTTYSRQAIYPPQYDPLIDRAFLAKHPEWPTMKWNKYNHDLRPTRLSWVREFDAQHPGYTEFVQSHQSGYYGGGVSEDFPQIWWESWKDRVETRSWDWCSFYHIWYADLPWWRFQVSLYKALHWGCGFRSINVQDEWPPEGAPEGVRLFFEELYPDRPWFEKA